MEHLADWPRRHDIALLGDAGCHPCVPPQTIEKRAREIRLARVVPEEPLFIHHYAPGAQIRCGLLLGMAPHGAQRLGDECQGSLFE